jgi:hypothetical protein
MGHYLYIGKFAGKADVWLYWDWRCLWMGVDVKRPEFAGPTVSDTLSSVFVCNLFIGILPMIGAHIQWVKRRDA